MRGRSYRRNMKERRTKDGEGDENRIREEEG